MLILVKRVELLRGIKIVINAISQKNIIEEAKSILLRAHKDYIRLHAEKHGIYVETDIEADVKISGEMSIETTIFL